MGTPVQSPPSPALLQMYFYFHDYSILTEIDAQYDWAQRIRLSKLRKDLQTSSLSPTNQRLEERNYRKAFVRVCVQFTRSS